MDEYNDVRKMFMEHFAVIGLLLGIDRSRYSILIIKLERNFTLRSNMYPTKRSERLLELNKYDFVRSHQVSR